MAGQFLHLSEPNFIHSAGVVDSVGSLRFTDKVTYTYLTPKSLKDGLNVRLWVMPLLLISLTRIDRTWRISLTRGKVDS